MSLRPRVKRVGFIALVAAAGLALLVGGFWVTMELVGALTAILYWVLFVTGITIFPFAIALGGNALPFNTAFGRLHVMLGAFAYNHHYLVDLGDRWEWCPGTTDRVWVNERWYPISEGFENMSVLGWRPFGILRFKDEETLREARVDTAAEHSRGAAADGGAITRAGVKEDAPPATTGLDGEWVLDLKRVFSRGVKKIGDVELVETAEEVIERGEVTQSRIEGWKPIIATFLGLVMGLPVFYMIFFG